jgi:hypothetical protein
MEVFALILHTIVLVERKKFVPKITKESLYPRSVAVLDMDLYSAPVNDLEMMGCL